MSKVLSLFTIILIGFPAFADSSHKQFTDYLKRKMNIAPIALQTVEVLNLDGDLFEVEESLHEQLLSIAQSQSEVWVDTILEGDYAVLGPITLEVIEELRSEQQGLLGYRITYSQQGWDTSTCDLSRATYEDLQKKETFAQCAAGRVVESAYVLANLGTYFADYDALATFEQ